MPVLILIEKADIFMDEINQHFANKYTVKIMRDDYKTVRSQMANQRKDTLYVIPGLSKPERYEIFCLARKNEAPFLSVVDESREGLVSSDKNVFVMGQGRAESLEKELGSSAIATTCANKRSKGVSAKGLGDLKLMIKEVNKDYLKTRGETEIVLKSCEDSLYRMWSAGVCASVEEARNCYKKMVEKELESKIAS